jgi:hypothetical protein
MSEDRFALSSQGLERGASICAKDFVFIWHDFEYPCSKFQAAFISPRVQALLLEDTTVSSLCINCGETDMEHGRVFDYFQQLMNGRSVQIDPSDEEDFLELANFLGNTELLNLFIDDSIEIEVINACSRLKHRSAVGLPVEAEIDFIASHFHQIESSTLKELNISLLERIVCSPSLRLINEDFLLSFICSLECHRPILLRYLLVEYLSLESLQIFLSYFSAFNIDALTWSSVCRRLLLPVPVTRSSFANARFVGERRHTKVEFPMKELRSLEGIISYLTQKYNGNVFEKGIITITSKSVYSDHPKYALKNVADLNDSDSHFWSKNEPGQWVCWDFRDMRVLPTHYTLRSAWLKSWVLEDSMDGENWREIDRQTNTQDSNAAWRMASFAISSPAECRFIRLTQTGANHVSRDDLYLRALELFGTLLE